MSEMQGTRQFNEEEVLLYNRLGSMISTWCKLQETGFLIQQVAADKELKDLENNSEDIDGD